LLRSSVATNEKRNTKFKHRRSKIRRGGGFPKAKLKLAGNPEGVELGKIIPRRLKNRRGGGFLKTKLKLAGNPEGVEFL
jgi:hypothetical protein